MIHCCIVVGPGVDASLRRSTNKDKYFSSITHKWTVMDRFHVSFVILGHFSNQKKRLHLLILRKEDVRCGESNQLGLIRQVSQRRLSEGWRYNTDYFKEENEAFTGCPASLQVIFEGRRWRLTPFGLHRPNRVTLRWHEFCQWQEVSQI